MDLSDSDYSEIDSESDESEEKLFNSAAFVLENIENCEININKGDYKSTCKLQLSKDKDSDDTKFDINYEHVWPMKTSSTYQVSDDAYPETNSTYQVSDDTNSEISSTYKASDDSNSEISSIYLLSDDTNSEMSSIYQVSDDTNSEISTVYQVSDDTDSEMSSIYQVSDDTNSEISSTDIMPDDNNFEKNMSHVKMNSALLPPMKFYNSVYGTNSKKNASPIPSLKNYPVKKMKIIFEKDIHENINKLLNMKDTVFTDGAQQVNPYVEDVDYKINLLSCEINYIDKMIKHKINNLENLLYERNVKEEIALKLLREKHMSAFEN